MKTFSNFRGGEWSTFYHGVDSLPKLVILEVNDKYIRGAFEAVVKSELVSNAPIETKYITNGEFRVKRSR